MNYVFSKSAPVYARKHSFFFGDEWSSIMREELSRFMSYTPPPQSKGHILQPNPPHTQRHTIQFRALLYVQKKQKTKQNNACERKPAVVMRQELEAGRKQTESVGLDWKSTLEKRQLPEL